MTMDPEVAKELFDAGAIVVFLDVPPNTEFGIDMNTWRTGEKFKGVKMLPPGLHLIYYSAVNKEGAVAPRTSFFHVFRMKETMIYRWDPQTEDMVHVADPEQEERLGANRRQLDRFLGAFPYETWKKWYSLTNHISADLIARVQPVNVKLSSASELVADDDQTKPSGLHRGASKEEDMLPRMHVKPGTELRFTKIPNNRYPEHSSPSDKTKYCLDSSFMLEAMLEKLPRAEDLLGELQIAFVSFLVAHMYDAFEHWKSLVHLICTADESLRKHPNFFLQFISCFHYQIQEIPEDFFTDITSRENFLVNTLHILFSNLEDGDVDSPLRERGRKFKVHLTKKFLWDFGAEPEDFAPVVVESTP